MLLLILFAALAGAATAVTPCVLPVLPALLSASATGGKRRPIGIVTGLALTFTITIAGLASVIDGVGVANGVERKIAIAVLFVAGLALLLPAVGDRIEAPLSRLARFGPRSRGEGFWSGMVVGAALGFLYAPCAGPILAAVVSLGVVEGGSARIILLAASYSVGSAAVLLVLSLGGRRVGRAPARRGPRARAPARVRRRAGRDRGVMSVNLDVRFQTALANHFPNFIVNPTKGLETSNAVERRLADLRGRSRFDSARPPATASTAPGPRSGLPVLGDAPDFTGNQRWFNTPGGQAAEPGEPARQGRAGRLLDLHLHQLHPNASVREGLVRALPGPRLVVVGVHTPEFGFEKNAGNVDAAIRQNGLRYPVAQDNDYEPGPPTATSSGPRST